MKFFRQGPDRLAEQPDFGGEEGPLAGFGLEEGTDDPDEIPHVHLLEEFISGGAHLVLPDVGLDLAALVLEADEGGLPEAVERHDPPGRREDGIVGLALRRILDEFLYRQNPVGYPEIVGVEVDALFFQIIGLLLPLQQYITFFHIVVITLSSVTILNPYWKFLRFHKKADIRVTCIPRHFGVVSLRPSAGIRMPFLIPDS